MSLATTLVVVMILAVLAFSLASTAVAHLGMVTHRDSSSQARSLARSAAAQALAMLVNDTTLGTPSNLGGNLTVQMAGNDGWGQVTFDPGLAALAGIPCSTNNLGNTSSTFSPDQTVVPAGGARLVAVGTYRGVRKQVEAIVTVPSFPFCLASSGSLTSPGQLMIAGVPTGTDPWTLMNTTQLAGTVPVDVQCNSGGNASISLGPSTQMAGNLRSVGGIQLATGVNVCGEVRPNEQAVNLPSVNLTAYDPGQLGRPYVTVTDIPAGTNVSGLMRCPGPSMVIIGDLVMDGGLLFVAGDLVVQGGLRGQGALVVTGNTTIQNGASFQADNQLALMTGGNLTLTGQGPASSCFQGLVVTAGALNATQISLVGVLVQNSATSSNGVALQGCTLLGTPVSAVTINVAAYTPPDNDTIVMSAHAYGNGGEVQCQETLTSTTSDVGAATWGSTSSEGYTTLPSFTLPSTTVQLLPQQGNGNVTVQVNGQTFASIDAAAASIASSSSGYPKNNNALATALEAYLTQQSTNYQQALAQATPASTLVIDPSQFMKLQDKIKVRLWRET